MTIEQLLNGSKDTTQELKSRMTEKCIRNEISNRINNFNTSFTENLESSIQAIADGTITSEERNNSQVSEEDKKEFVTELKNVAYRAVKDFKDNIEFILGGSLKPTEETTEKPVEKTVQVEIEAKPASVATQPSYFGY